MEEEFLNKIKEQAGMAARELLEKARLTEGDILVAGCSSSEVMGEKIGTSSSVETARAVFAGIYEAVQKKGVYLAAQCCEHLNRAIIIEKALARRERLSVVNVVPQPKAGGTFATTAYERFAQPVVVEQIRAQAGMDIGDTLIGMHLEEVAVPVRLETKQIGRAHLVCARTRGKFIGGERAIYDQEML